MPYKDREKKNEARRRWRANRSPQQRALDNERARVSHHRAWQNASDGRKAAVRARKRAYTYAWYRRRSEEQKAKDLESKRRSAKMRALRRQGVREAEVNSCAARSLVTPQSMALSSWPRDTP